MVIEARSQLVTERRSQMDSQLVKTKSTALAIPTASKPEKRTRSRATTSSAIRANRVRQCQRIDEGQKGGDVFKCRHPNLYA